MFFYNFFFKYIYILNRINYFKQSFSLSNCVLVNFKNKQVKLNYVDIKNKKVYIYTLGLVLKILDLYKKSSRRNIIFLKYLINFLIKKYQINQGRTILIAKGLVKNYIKLIYYFKSITSVFNISIFYVNPIKIFNNLKIKKKRCIKRRLYKKLVDFNKV